MRRIRPVVWLIFFVSGASGLIYEVVWMRQLTLVFGSTVFATSTVLSAFMAGLALGGFYFGRRADREAHPLRLYAILEAGVGLFALVFPLLLTVLNAVYILIYRGLTTEFYILSLIRFILSFLVLLIPSTLMGGTLPVISKFFVRRFEKLGFNVGLLYALNTFGAVAGCVAAGFFLIQLLGVKQSLYLAAALNLIVAAIAFLLNQRRVASEAAPTEETPPAEREPLSAQADAPTNPARRLSIWAFAASGFCALAYEVLWTRILVFFLGGTTYAFSTMLAAFLFGLAFGSFLFSWLADRTRSIINIFGLVQVGIGLSAVALIPAFGELYGLSRAFQSVFGPGRVWAFVACVIVMIIPTILMGASFPLVARIYTRSQAQLGRSIGAIYSLNTIGAILGAFFAGFILIPLIGIRPTIFLTAALNAVVGCTLILRNTERTAKTPLFSGTAVGGAILTGGVGLMMLLWANTPLFLKSAIFQTQRPGDTLVEYKEEVDASITTLKDDEGVYRLYVDTNQAADASRWDSPSHRVIAHLPLLLHPRPQRALVVGFGMGVTSYSITQHGVHVDAIEISKGVIEAARKHFTHVNKGVLDSPLFNYEVNDGRNYILMTTKKYDMISTGIIHPLVSSGSSYIYTADFYRLCKRILTEDGMMCQWVPLHRLPEAHFKVIVRTFIEVFPHTSIWYKYTPDFVILIGTPAPLKINYKDFIARANNVASIREGLAHDDLDGMSLLDSFMMGEENARRYVGDGPIHTDDRPRLEFFRAQDLVNTTYKNIAGMAPFREKATPYLTNYGDTMEEKLAARQAIDRYFNAAQKLIQGQIEYAKGQFERALGYFNEAVAINPDDDVIRYNLGVVVGLVDEGQQEELRQLEKLVKQTLQSNPQDAEGHLQLAVIYESQGKLPEAAEALEKAIKYEPKRRDLYLLLGPIYERQERYDEALNTYQRLEQISSELPADLYAVMASLYLHKQMQSEALVYAQKALAADPGSWRVHYLMGNIHAGKNDLKAAVDAFKKAIQLAPNEPMPYSDLADAYVALNRRDEALRSVEKAIELAPNEPYFQEQRDQIRSEMQ